MNSQRSVIAFLYISLSAPVLAFTPGEEYYCCRQPDTRGAHCARFALTPQRCAEIFASVNRIEDERAAQQRALSAYKKRDAEFYDAMKKNDASRFRALMADESNPPGLKNVERSPRFITLAASLGSDKIVSELIAAGADVNGLDVYKKSALLYASEKGNVAVVSTLIAAGADVNTSDRDEQTALFHASKLGYLEVVRLLIAAGADVHRKSIWGRNALWWAKSGKHDETAAVLIKNGARDEP